MCDFGKYTRKNYNAVFTEDVDCEAWRFYMSLSGKAGHQLLKFAFWCHQTKLSEHVDYVNFMEEKLTRTHLDNIESQQLL